MFLGDLVGYGPNPNEVIHLFRELEKVHTIVEGVKVYTKKAGEYNMPNYLWKIVW